MPTSDVLLISIDRYQVRFFDRDCISKSIVIQETKKCAISIVIKLLQDANAYKMCNSIVQQYTNHPTFTELQAAITGTVKSATPSVSGRQIHKYKGTEPTRQPLTRLARVAIMVWQAILPCQHSSIQLAKKELCRQRKAKQ